MLGIFQAEKA